MGPFVITQLFSICLAFVMASLENSIILASICMYVYVCVYIYICVYIHVCVYTCYIYIYIVNTNN